MAAIKTQLQLNDGMTSVLRKINSALLTCLDGFESMQGASGQAINVQNIQAARAQLVGVTQELEEVSSGQEDANEQISKGVQLSDSLLGKIVKIAGAYLSLRSAVNFVKDAIESAQEAANIDVQLAVSLKNQGMGQDAFDSLKETASEYGMYTQTAMTAAAAEFATYMSDTDAIASMMDTLTNYAAGMSGGGALDTSQMVDYATQLGKVLNGTYDGIAKKGFEVTESQKEILENGTDMEKAAVVADIINESWGGLYEQMANTPEGQLLSLNNTISQLKENLGNQLMPYVLQVVQLIQTNMPTIETLINAVGAVLQAMVPVLLEIIDTVAGIAEFFINNWSWIEPIVWGIVAALIAYEAITKSTAIALAIHEIAEKAKAAAQALATGQTLAQTAAQYGLNAALLASPITWIVLAIAALIVIIYKWIQSVGGITNAWNICKAALLVAWNAIKVAWYAVVYAITWGVNKVLNFVDTLKLCWQKAGVAIANFMGDMKVSVLTILQNMINGAIDIINKFINTLNKIPGVNISAIEHVTFATTAAAENEAAKQARAEDLANYESELDAARAERDANLQNAKDNLDNATDELSASAAELAAMYNDSKTSSSAEDTAAYDTTAGILDSTSAISNDTESISEDVSSAASSLKSVDEDLKYLRDLAEQEAVNRFTTAEVKIDMTGMTNRIDSDVDLDGVLTVLTEGFAEALETAAEGVHT